LENKKKENLLSLAERISEVGILVGGSAALEHRLQHGRWYDEDKPICHGKIGIGVLALSFVVRIGCAVVRAAERKCPHCGETLTPVPREQSYYCSTCQVYFSSTGQT